MPIIRGVEVHLKSTADTGGVAATTAALKGLDAQVQAVSAGFKETVRQSDMRDLQAAVGVMKQEVGEMSSQAMKSDGVMLKLAQTSQMLFEQQTAGKITDEAATLKWQRAINGAEQQLVSMAEKGTKSQAAIQQSMRLTSERAVMLGNAAAGMAMQFGAGADSTQLLASGLTSVAMIMSTAGPWGMAAGFALQMLTQLGLGWKKLGEEAEKAAKAQSDKMTATIADLNNAKVAQDSLSNSIKSTVAALDAQTAAMGRLHKAQAEQREREAQQKKLDAEVADQERSAAVADGRMTEDEAKLDQVRQANLSMFDEHQAKLAKIDEAEESARREKAAAQEEFAAQQKGIEDTEQRYLLARRTANAESRAEATKKRLDSAKEESEGLETHIGHVGAVNAPLQVEQLKNLNSKIEALEQQLRGEQNVAATVGQGERFLRTKDGKVDVDKEKAALDSLRSDSDAKLGALFRRDQDADAAITSAQADREAANQNFESAKIKYRGGLKTPEEQAAWDGMEQPWDADQRRADYELEVDKTKMRRDNEQRAQRGGAVTDTTASLVERLNALAGGREEKQGREDGPAGMLRAATAKMQDGADQSEMSEAAQALIQAASTQDAAIKQLAQAARQALELAKSAMKEAQSVAASARAAG